MAYMYYAQYDYNGQRLVLNEDYRAIRWMQDHIKGSPVIVEANCPEYRWCTRFTIYTGLPGVVGWNFHQRQQRARGRDVQRRRVLHVGQKRLGQDQRMDPALPVPDRLLGICGIAAGAPIAEQIGVEPSRERQAFDARQVEGLKREIGRAHV